ncbi:MAG: peptide deformylase [Candidatus Paceibacterota bacterium]
MKETDIKQAGDPVLREVAKPVSKDQITSPEIKQIIADMKSALHDTKDGIAIAAPQIGKSVRIFIVSGAVFATEENPEAEDMIFINPDIISTSRKKITLDEGCLSVRGKYGKTERSVQASVQAQDKNGVAFQLGASGLLAQIFQHETDHLDGVLFIDKATDVEDVPTESKDELTN